MAHFTMRNAFLTVFLLLNYLAVHAQDKIRFRSTVNIGTFSYFTSLVMVDPGPGWNGYNLPRHPGTGIRVSITNGICISDLFHIGIGAGYANFSGISGMMLFGDIRADFSKKPFAIFAYVNPGYSHFWNQYEGGTGTAMFDFGLGARHKIFAKSYALLSIGLLSMQQNTYISVKLGYTF